MISFSMSPWKNPVLDLGTMEERGISGIARPAQEEGVAAPSPSVKGSIDSEVLEISGLGSGESNGKKGLFTENERSTEQPYCCRELDPKRGQIQSERREPNPSPS